MPQRTPIALPEAAAPRGAESLAPGAQLEALSAFSGVHASYGWKNLAITLWFGPATLESLPVFERGCKAFCDAHPEGVSSVHIMVPGGSSMPTQEARTELARIMREYAHTAAGAAVVIPGAGFWASALRGLITALAMLAPRGFALQIFGELPDVAAWLAPLHQSHTGCEISAHELLHALTLVERAGTAAAA